MLMFATIVALQGVPALYAPASVLSCGVFGKVTDKATDSEKGLVKLWGGASRREVDASYRMRPPSRASFQRRGHRPWPCLYSAEPADLVPALEQAMCANVSRRHHGVIGCPHRQPRPWKERARVSCLFARAADRRSVRVSLFVSKGTMASDLKPWYVKMVLSSKSITCDFGMVPLTLMALIFLGML
jgi:hypothetical protein